MTEEAKPTITFSSDGPMVVNNVEDLRTSDGKLEAPSTMALCRCGGSKNKPFCDGMHTKLGFSSKATADASKDKCDTYTGVEITVRDNRSVCAHAGHCTDGLPAVFRMKQKPWIDADGAQPDEIVDVISQCPSGALDFSGAGGGPPRHEGKTSITVAPGGPYVVKGAAELVDVKRGEGASQELCTLCRCGASKNKPFCDGSHWNVEFDESKTTGS